MVEQITPVELKKELDAGQQLFILDVREEKEWQIVNLSHLGATLIPMSSVLEQIDQLPKTADIIVHCRSGARSATIIQQLKPLGFTQLRNLDGGINRWSREVEPHLPTY